VVAPVAVAPAVVAPAAAVESVAPVAAAVAVAPAEAAEVLSAELTPVTLLDEPFSDAAVVMPELGSFDLLAPSELNGVDEVFALEEADDAVQYEGTPEDAADGSDYSDYAAEDDAFRDADARTAAGAMPATASDHSYSDSRLSQLASNPFEAAQDGRTEVSEILWGAGVGNDLEGNFDFRMSDSEVAAGFTLPDDDTGEVSPGPEPEPPPTVHGFQTDDRTPNEDDTAVMRRAWAWADEEAPVVKDAKAVDLGPDPFARPALEPSVPSGRKPARVRLRYPDPARLGEEYRENLRKGGTFVKTAKPLAVGRECICEVSAPGLDDTLLFPAVVTFVATSAPGQDAGMGIEYRLSESERRSVERIIDRL
jgi:type IV pilus assembly protein PilZ